MRAGAVTVGVSGPVYPLRTPPQLAASFIPEIETIVPDVCSATDRLPVSSLHF